MSWAPVKVFAARVATLVLPTALSTRSMIMYDPAPIKLVALAVKVMDEMSLV
jgi:hypothetical protein